MSTESEIIDRLSIWKYSPYNYYDNKLSRDSITKYYRSQLLTHIQEGDFHIEADSTYFIVEALKWDSMMLGFKTARLYRWGNLDVSKVDEKCLSSVDAYCQREGIQYLVTRINAADTYSIHGLETQGYVMVDGILTYSLDISRDSEYRSNSDKFTVRILEEGDIQQVIGIAQNIYKYDRFHSDPAILSEKADKLHAEWLRNSCSGSVADKVIVSALDNNILGFVTCKIDRLSTQYLGLSIGTIVLVGVINNASGMGVGKEMTKFALEWFKRNNVGIVEVGTQLSNIRASRLYESCGFKLVNSNISFRKLIKER
jgi:dTDP-4-amino-4,6-dideoxy-D-galactose acyltransferase